MLAAKNLKVPEKPKELDSPSKLNVPISTLADHQSISALTAPGDHAASLDASSKTPPAVIVSISHPSAVEVTPTGKSAEITAVSPLRSGSHGPRIKHVCRRAAVALGVPAIFPSPDALTLSALPTQEKQKILSERDKEERPGKIVLMHTVKEVQVLSCYKVILYY